MAAADPAEETAQKLNDLGANETLYKPHEIDQAIGTINKPTISKQAAIIA